MQAIAIVALCIGSAVAYGILHDQVTARVCVEYFTIGHPRYSPPCRPQCSGSGGASSPLGGSVCCWASRWPSPHVPAAARSGARGL